MSDKAVIVLRDKYKNKTCYIVGKGTSLQFLKASDFKEDGFIITMNEAIAKVQDISTNLPIYSMQKDGCDWQMIKPKNGVTLIVQPSYSGEYFTDYPDRLELDPVDDQGFLITEMSIRMVISLGKTMGTDKIILMCCDSMLGDNKTWNPLTNEITDVEEGFYSYVKPLVYQDLLHIPHEFIAPSED